MLVRAHRLHPTTDTDDNDDSSNGNGAAPVYSARLIDFGLSRRTPEPEGLPIEGRLLGGKGAYVAPELVDGTVRDWHAADVWSLGVCLYNLCTGLTLYSHPSDPAFTVLATEGQNGARRLLRHHIHNYAVYLNPAAAHLIASMLHPVPARRPTYEQILQHPWVLGGEEWEWDGVVAFS
jgi:serine/threonine protein kinase